MQVPVLRWLSWPAQEIGKKAMKRIRGGGSTVAMRLAGVVWRTLLQKDKFVVCRKTMQICSTK